MNDDPDLFSADAKQSYCLYDFETLVHERSRVDSYLPAHVPSGMTEYFANLWPKRRSTAPEWTTRCREDQAGDGISGVAGNTLMDGSQLGIHWQNVAASSPRCPTYMFSKANKQLLGCQSNALASQ
ncbi:MAG: hypothetical protein ABIK37_03175 [candidate division WOR-3 bacterium]